MMDKSMVLKIRANKGKEEEHEMQALINKNYPN